MLYSKLEPIEGNLVSIEFLLLDYTLGIKKKDNNYFALIKYKNEVKGLNPATILNLPWGFAIKGVYLHEKKLLPQ